MKRKLFFVTTIISGLSFGQSFTTANEPAIGAILQMYQCDSSAASFVATTGSGVTWDYANIMKMTNPDKIYSMLDNTNLTDFPLSNKTLVIPGALITYLETTATERNILGFEFNGGSLGNVKVNFNTDKMNQMTYPFALNDNIVDAMTGTVNYTGGSSACTGTSTSTVDGMGTLLLSPTVTKTNVIRHHNKSVINTTVLIFNVDITIDQFEYYDFVSSNLPLFSYTNIKIVQAGSTVTSLNFVLNTELPASTVSLEDKAITSVNFYPNPAQEQISFNGANGTEQVQITDLAGKLVLSTTTASPVNVASLASGVYTIAIESNGQLIQDKFVKN